MKKKVTASELMTRLNANPEYIVRKKDQEKESKLKFEQYSLAEAPLVKALNAAGVRVSSVWDLVNAAKKKISSTLNISTDSKSSDSSWLSSGGGSYVSVLPLLLDHIQKSYPDAVRDGIARSLAVPEAKFAWPLLVKLYKEERQSTRTKQGLAVALSNIAGEDNIEDVIDLVCDPRLGESRVLLLGALERHKNPATNKILAALEPDPHLHKEVKALLRRLSRDNN